MALILGGLPRSLWPHDVVVCPLFRLGEFTMTPGPVKGYDETRGSRPQNDTDFFLETLYTVCIWQTKSYSNKPTKHGARRYSDDPTKLTATVCAGRRQTTTTGSVGGRINRP